MEIINGVNRLPAVKKPLFVALGNFDGVHRGHQVILKRLVDRAKNLGGSSAVLLLNPHPVIALGKEKPIDLLTDIADRSEIMAKIGLDYLVVIPFTEQFSSLTPEQFVKQMLVESFSAKGVFIGENYRFGRQGSGSAATLRYWGNQFDFSVDVIPLLSYRGREVSSSLIRSLLLSGAVGEAADYLNYFFFRQGKVIRGYGIGRKLVYPTANVYAKPNLLWPGKGVYLTAVGNVAADYRFGVTNIGSRPTFARYEPSIETHIINFEGTLYNREIRLCFLEKLRDTRTFSDPARLKEQIKKDIERGEALIPSFVQEIKGNSYSLQVGCSMLRSQ